MVERNPYETNTPVDVPHFMKESAEPKKVANQDVDMSVFKLREDELKNTDEIKAVKKKAKKKAKANSLLGVITIVCVLIAAICLILFISSSNKYKSLKSEYDTYKETAESKIDRLNKQVETVTKEFEDYKATTVVVEEKPEEEKPEKKEEQSSQTPTKTTLKAGEYTINYSIYLRKGAGSNKDIVKFDDLPQQIQWIAYANSTTVAGSKINVKEIKVVSDSVWGKLADDVWVCLKDGNSVFVE